MGYYIDLKKISIEQYMRVLETADLLPSRTILRDQIEENFERIKTQGIKNVEELLEVLKNKSKLQDFSKQSGIGEEYLKILIRELNSYRQKPNKIKDFPGVSEDTVTKLEALGIKNTLQLYDKVLTPESRKELAKRTGIGDGEVLQLAKLSDLSRIRWVNHTFAYVLHEAGYDRAGKVAQADYEQMYESVKALNAERQIYRGHIGAQDMKRCVEAAKDVPLDIEY